MIRWLRAIINLRRDMAEAFKEPFTDLGGFEEGERPWV